LTEGRVTTQTVVFEDVLPVLLEAFRDFVRSQEGGSFRIHARKFGTFVRDAIKFPPPGQKPRYLELSKDVEFMDGNDHLAGLALSKLAEPENSVITPVRDREGETAARAGVGFIYEFTPGGKIAAPDSVPLSSVKPPKYSIRYVGDVTRMMDSIKNEGQLVPIIVRPCREAPYEYEVIDGFTRYRSIDYLGYIDRIRIEVQDLSDAEAVKKALALNMVRYQMNDLEQAKTFSLMIANKWGTVQTIASLVGYSTDYVRARLALLEAPPEIQERLVRRDISMDRALSFTKLVREEKIDRNQATEIIDQSNALRLSSRQTSEVVEEVERFELPVDQAVSRVLERDDRTFRSREKRTIIAVRTNGSTTKFVCPHGTELEVDWSNGEVFRQTSLEAY
jgi:ParB family transcriptional regulator, chromosome partitioning protein